LKSLSFFKLTQNQIKLISPTIRKPIVNKWSTQLCWVIVIKQKSRNNYLINVCWPHSVKSFEYPRQVRGHSNNTWHAQVCQSVTWHFSKILNPIFVYLPAFLKVKGQFFGKSNCHVTTGEGAHASVIKWERVYNRPKKCHVLFECPFTFKRLI